MTEPSIKARGRCLLAHLRRHSLDEYGSVILSADVRSVIGVHYPELGTKKVFDTLSLAELSAVDYVRQVLLGEGKYFAQHDGDYRILLPSENARQIEDYMRHADNKLKRAQRLSKSTPRAEPHQRDNLAARLHVKRESIRTHITMGNAGGDA